MPKVMARVSITLLVLGFVSGIVAGVPEDEVQNHAQGNGRPANRGLDDTTVIAYDDGTPYLWVWCYLDSFGAAVRFTPAAYPCYVVGARAVVGCDTTFGGHQVYLRVYNDDGTGGLPGTVLYEQLRRDVPQVYDTSFHDYDLTSPVTIDSGDFYICFWQKYSSNLLFSIDTHFDSTSRQWWFVPGQGWVTPSVSGAADHLIRARVLYSPGVEEDLAASQVPRTDQHLAGIVRGVLFLPLASSVRRGASCVLLDVSGRRVLDLRAGANDVRSLASGVYFVREEPQASSPKPQAVRKVAVTR